MSDSDMREYDTDANTDAVAAGLAVLLSFERYAVCRTGFHFFRNARICGPVQRGLPRWWRKALVLVGTAPEILPVGGTLAGILCVEMLSVNLIPLVYVPEISDSGGITFAWLRTIAYAATGGLLLPLVQRTFSVVAGETKRWPRTVAYARAEILIGAQARVHQSNLDQALIRYGPCLGGVLAFLIPVAHTTAGHVAFPSSSRRSSATFWVQPAARSATRKQDCYLSGLFRSLAARRCVEMTVIAAANTMLIISHTMLLAGRSSQKLGGDYPEQINRDGLQRCWAKRSQGRGLNIICGTTDRSDLRTCFRRRTTHGD